MTSSYDIGSAYPVTEVLAWWLAELEEEPEWVPVMGTLHEDTKFFGLKALHLHADARFLSTAQQRRAGRVQRRRRIFNTNSWHASYQVVITEFPIEGEDGLFFRIDSDSTAVMQRNETRSIERLEGREWGLAQIRTRELTRRCRRQLPAARADRETAAGFHELRRAYPDARGDRCPHRGYDLRSVPIEADGCRQCPLHQLRVRAG